LLLPQTEFTQDIGLQAAQRISTASNPLGLLQEISQNFPSLAPALTRLRVSPELRTEVLENQQLISPGCVPRLFFFFFANTRSLMFGINVFYAVKIECS
jgi:hypothetical protein